MEVCIYLLYLCIGLCQYKLQFEEYEIKIKLKVEAYELKQEIEFMYFIYMDILGKNTLVKYDYVETISFCGFSVRNFLVCFFHGTFSLYSYR